MKRPGRYQTTTDILSLRFSQRELAAFMARLKLRSMDRLRVTDALQAKTPVPGLILGGQDVLSPGIPGALWGGIFAAASVDPMVWRELPS